MKEINSSSLKTILHSKRANMFYIEHCRVLMNGGRVEYVTEEAKQSLYWNIPIANTTVILLGTGTSITQAAVRELAKAGVLIGFCGASGSPLFAGSEVVIDIEFLASHSEYRPTKYCQAWMRLWLDDALRMNAAREFQEKRLDFIRKCWTSAAYKRDGFSIFEPELDSLISGAKSRMAAAPTVNDILTEEARMTKALYAMSAKASGYGSFTRAKLGSGEDPANERLDHGNYLAYGLAGTAIWVLGIPSSLSIVHGKTRRGGLVFDVADLVKDALVLPLAFMSASKGEDDKTFRSRCIAAFASAEALDLMIEQIQNVCDKVPVIAKTSTAPITLSTQTDAVLPGFGDLQ